MKYNKLIRDRIPEIINKDCKSASFKFAKGNELKEYLVWKLLEEVAEFIEAKNIEELADVLEVLDALSKNLGFIDEEVKRVKEEKKMKCGGFEKGIILLEVQEDV